MNILRREVSRVSGPDRKSSKKKSGKLRHFRSIEESKEGQREGGSTKLPKIGKSKSGLHQLVTRGKGVTP